MPKVKLDHAFCLTAGCQAGKRKTTYWDTTTTGFVMEVRVAGRTYALRYIDRMCPGRFSLLYFFAASTWTRIGGCRFIRIAFCTSEEGDGGTS